MCDKIWKKWNLRNSHYHIQWEAKINNFWNAFPKRNISLQLNIYVKIKKMWNENLLKKCIACILSRKNLFSRYFHFIFPLRDWVQAYKHLRNNEKMQRKKIVQNWWLYVLMHLFGTGFSKLCRKKLDTENFNIWHREF